VSRDVKVVFARSWDWIGRMVKVRKKETVDTTVRVLIEIIGLGGLH
jgi:hypothetical protein